MRMLLSLAGRARERELRLFNAACCRRIGNTLSGGSRHAIGLIERFVDGEVGAEKAIAAWHTEIAAFAAWNPSVANIAFVAANAARVATDPTAERLAQCALLRDLFDPLYWPRTIDPLWRTPLVLSMGRSIYDEHSFGDLPILADALEEAGCENADLLSHLRGRGPHARGCWALALVLGRE